jgi:hypothetical protein
MRCIETSRIPGRSETLVVRRSGGCRQGGSAGEGLGKPMKYTPAGNHESTQKLSKFMAANWPTEKRYVGKTNRCNEAIGVHPVCQDDVLHSVS